MKRMFAVVLTTALTASGLEVGTLEEFREDYCGGYSRDLELLYVDYGSGEPVLMEFNPYMDSPRALDITGRYPAGMGLPAVGGALTNPPTVVYEVPGEGGWALEVILHHRHGETVALLDGPGEDIQPEVFGNRCVAYARENSDGGYDIALWTEDSGVKVLDLGPGDQMWPTFFYAASEEELAPPDANPYTFEPEPGELDPLNEPVVIVYQDDSAGDSRLHYAVTAPGGAVRNSGELTGLDFDGEALCPDIHNQYYRRPDYYPDGSTPLAFHGLVEGNRDIYLTRVRLEDGAAGARLVAEGLMKLTDWPGQEKFPELFLGWEGTDGTTVTWCFFSADRDGDYDIYALRVEGGRIYQLTDLPGTQTAPLAVVVTDE
jgi:hypothetical protein